jgi:hypothetical protein
LNGFLAPWPCLRPVSCSRRNKFSPLKKGGVAHFAALFYFVSAQCLPSTIPAEISGFE